VASYDHLVPAGLAKYDHLVDCNLPGGLAKCDHLVNCNIPGSLTLVDNFDINTMHLYSSLIPTQECFRVPCGLTLVDNFYYYRHAFTLKSNC
jgi:hypothetical protein